MRDDSLLHSFNRLKRQRGQSGVFLKFAKNNSETVDPRHQPMLDTG